MLEGQQELSINGDTKYIDTLVLIIYDLDRKPRRATIGNVCQMEKHSRLRRTEDKRTHLDQGKWKESGSEECGGGWWIVSHDY